MTSPIVNQNNLIELDDNFCEIFSPLIFNEKHSFVISTEPILITDPINLADIFNSNDPIASYVRSYGVFAMNFGGDAESRVWYQYPNIFIPLSIQYWHEEHKGPVAPQGVKVFPNRIYTDSGSFVFLPLYTSQPPELCNIAYDIVKNDWGVQLNLPSGRWTIYYEQCDVPDNNDCNLYRNIVCVHTP